MKSPYRDDAAVLEARKEEIARRLGELDARREKARELEREEAALRAELFGIEQRIGARRKVLALDNIKVASPCSARWDDMVGDERVRFCGSCAKNVFNLSAMQKDEAEALLREKNGSLCVRYYQRRDGTVLTADCPVGVTKKRVRRLAILAVGFGAAVSSASVAAMAAATKMGKPCSRENVGAISAVPVMGEPAPPASAEPPAQPAPDDSYFIRQGATTPPPGPTPRPADPVLGRGVPRR